VQLYGHIIDIYRRNGERGERKVGKEGKGDGETKRGKRKFKEAKVK